MSFAPDPTLRNAETDWSLLYLAHAPMAREARPVWNQIFLQYDRPVWQFLRSLVRDDHALDDIYQEFWHRFLKGDFAHATPERGRFRYLLMKVLANLVADYYRRAKRTPGLLLEDPVATDDDLLEEITARSFMVWRRQLLNEALAALARAEEGRDALAHQVLQVEIEFEDHTSDEKAVSLSQRLQREISAANYRQLLSRSRKHFAQKLIEQVRMTLADPTPELIREELAELRLLIFCEGELP
ncbi:hypothetical protein GC163_14640 [bacterium]|nr:hypothetical protein [bacterium]